MTLHEELIHLVETSQSLLDNPEEQAFWLQTISGIGEPELLKLKEILLTEAKKRSDQASAHAAYLEKLDNTYLEALKSFRHKDLPSFMKQAEEALQGNPEDLLNQL